jgi:MerR family Zn(II)-responsive transcriptional regulator of zntA
MAMKVSDLARRAGISPDSVRYYEELGLLPEAPRTPAGYRQFDEEVLSRIRFIKSAQSLGLRLSDIGDLLKIQDDGGCPCGHTKTLLDRRLDQVNEEIRTLLSLRDDLERLRSSECFSDPEACWPCELELTRKGGDPLAG